MLYELLLVIIGCMVAFLVIKQGRLSTKTKRLIWLVMAILVLLGVSYETMKREQNESDRAIVNAYYQGKTLRCGSLDVSSKTFIFVSGTLSFIPNDKNSDNRGVVIEISTCKILP